MSALPPKADIIPHCIKCLLCAKTGRRRKRRRGFDPTSYPTKPLVSYRIYRHLSGWNPPPLVTRAFWGALPTTDLMMILVLSAEFVGRTGNAGWTRLAMTPNDLICYPLRPNTGFHRHSPAQITFKQGETDMGDKGKKDKGKKEQQKKAQLSPKEKRKLKKENKK